MEFQAENLTDGYVLDIEPRKNALIRPPIANVDIAILVFSAVEPAFSTTLLDRFLVAIEKETIQPIICVSKLDLADNDVQKEIRQYQAIYQTIGYSFLLLNEPDSLSELTKLVSKKTAVIAGQSGVGKSTFLNRLNSDLRLKTAEISGSLGRGKHTTRHVEFLPIGDGFVADTPGFSSIEWQEMKPEEVEIYFPEIEATGSNCKFRGCLHDSEPKCAVKTAVEAGDIARFRYQHYLQILAEIKNRKPRY